MPSPADSALRSNTNKIMSTASPLLSSPGESNNDHDADQDDYNNQYRARVVVLTNIDYVSACIPYLREYFDEGLVVIHGAPQSASELARSASNVGWSSLVSADIDLIETVVRAFGRADYKLVIGQIFDRTLQKLFHEDASRVRQILYSDQECTNAEAISKKGQQPMWPEFIPIWNGDRHSILTVKDFITGEFITSMKVDVSEEDTALSLRYKHTQKLPDLLGALIANDFNAIDIERMSTTSSACYAAWKSRLTPDTPAYIDQSLPVEKVERYIRAMNFPPYDPAVVVSKVDDQEYFCEYAEQYRDYLRDVKEADIDNAKNKNDKKDRTAADMLLQNRYAADTHWYSNIGGTIVKVTADRCKMQRKDEKSMYIPGQAVTRGAKKKLRMNEPLIGLTAKYYIDKALSSKWIGVEGPYIKKFEAALAKICDTNAACAVQSGTAALYGAVKALGVSSSSQLVICPTYTCAACADAVVHAGGTPIAVDCELDSYGLDYQATVAALEKHGSKVVGVIIAPAYGVPARDHNKIYEECQRRGIWLCEDNCESYGASMDVSEMSQKYKNVGVDQTPVGSMSTISVVSVRSEKMVGVGEGGAIMSKDVDLISRARWWCSRAPVKGGGMWKVYEHQCVGQNFRLPECLGALGLAACENLPVMIEQKRKIHDWYVKYMHPTYAQNEEKVKEHANYLREYLSTIQFQKEKPLDKPVWWINSLLLPGNAEKIGLLLMGKYPHIEVRPAFYPLHKMGIFVEQAEPSPNADFLYDRLLCLPSSANLVEEDIMEICSAVRECVLEAHLTTADNYIKNDKPDKPMEVE